MTTGMAGTAISATGREEIAAHAVVAPRLQRAAHEFEAQLMKELLRPLTESGSLTGDSDGGETGTLGEFASESLAGALSAGGGLGIANRIVGELSHSGNGSKDSRVTGKFDHNTTMSTPK